MGCKVSLFHLLRKTLHHCRLPERNPITFVDSSGNCYRMGHELTHTPMLTDLGSIPVLLRWRYPHDLYERSYLFHDYACERGGLFTFKHNELGMAGWHWTEITRRRADELLREMILAEQDIVSGGRRLDAQIIYLAVRAWAWAQKPTDASGTEAW